MKFTIFVSFTFLVVLSGFCRGGDVTPINSELMQPLPIVSGPLLADKDKPATIDLRSASNKNSANGDEESGDGRVSVVKAVVLSLVFPGAGEYYAGAKFKGQVFMGVEAALWGGFIAYRVYGGWKEDDYKAYAAANAGVDNSGKNEDFYDLVGFYMNREEANQLGMLFNTNREYMPDTRAYYWQWTSDADRAKFRKMKEGADIAYRNSNWMLALALLNRVVSGYDAFRVARGVNNEVASVTQFGNYKIDLESKMWSENPSINLRLVRHF